MNTRGERRAGYALLLAALAATLAVAALAPARAWAQDESEPSAPVAGEFSSVSDLADKRIGVQTGTTYDEIMQKNLPNAQISYYNTNPDLAEALLTNKIDAFPGDEPAVKLVLAENPGLTVIDEHMDSFDFGFVFPKTEAGERLRDEFNDWLANMVDSGELERISAKWIEGPEDQKTILDYHALPAPKGTLTFVTEGAYPPMNYYKDNEVVGIDVDLATLFCQSAGYGLEIEVMNFDGIIPAVQAGKADFSASGLTITEERKESVYFSDPYYTGGTMMAVRAAAGGASSPLAHVGESFEKTFVREDRWRLFAEGVVTTLLITLASIVLGTALGFGLYLLCRGGNRLANRVTGACLWLVQGTPGVVLLMILYYIVFGSLSLSGVVVSVVAFTLTFGASVFGLLRLGVNAVDAGQYEAAQAMGYTDRQTFFQIILPQALPHVMSSFRAEIVSLVKATAIVGYIAVQDLTKMGDLVRSRTYEAFFPLIAITVIYFALEGVLSFFARRLELSLDPKRRSCEAILKGVKADD